MGVGLPAVASCAEGAWALGLRASEAAACGLEAGLGSCGAFTAEVEPVPLVLQGRFLKPLDQQGSLIDLLSGCFTERGNDCL